MKSSLSQKAKVFIKRLTKENIDYILNYHNKYTVEELAELLYISLSTVKTHINNIYTKASCNSLGELIYKYYNKQLISGSE